VICFFGEYLESLWMLYRGRSSLNWELSIFLLCCTGARSFLAQGVEVVFEVFGDFSE
jgi:hypothetical protein